MWIEEERRLSPSVCGKAEASVEMRERFFSSSSHFFLSLREDTDRKVSVQYIDPVTIIM